MADPQTMLALNATPTADMVPITGTIMLEFGAESVPALLAVSLNPAPFEVLLPIFHGIADALVKRGVARAAAAPLDLAATLPQRIRRRPPAIVGQRWCRRCRVRGARRPGDFPVHKIAEGVIFA